VSRNSLVLKIRREHLDEIFEVARKFYPIEACGILVGKANEREKIVAKVYHTKNILASSLAYQVDPIEQLRVFEDAEREGSNILGFYHSHPFWDSFWSKVDEERSKYWVGYSYLIISLTTGNATSYIRYSNKVEIEELAVL